LGGPGQTPGHEGDHGPQDHGFVAGGQVLVVAGGAPVLADRREGAFDDPAAGPRLLMLKSPMMTQASVPVGAGWGTGATGH